MGSYVPLIPAAASVPRKLSTREISLSAVETWLGYGVIVLGGVHIGAGAVVAAGSVVIHDIPDNAIAMGSPARVVKMRSELA